jgi:hypothetical protein
MIQQFPNPSPSPPEGLMEAGWRVPVVGWRTWRARPVAGGAALEGVHTRHSWDPGTTHAGCRRCPPWMSNLHPIPSPSCECGLYAFSNPDEAFRYLNPPEDTPDGGDRTQLVAGAVIAWGRVVQHGGQGWRAQHARPVALLDSGHPLLEALARRHRVPLVSARGLRLLPLEYGEAFTG